jgi:hypothetical protein
MPSSTGSYLGRVRSSRPARAFSSIARWRSTCSPLQELAVALVGDLDLAQHLANDHLDVLVVDLHALQAVDVLDFLHQVRGQRLDAEQAQDVLRVRLAVHHGLALLHVLAFEHDDLAVLRDQLFVLLPSASLMIRRCLPLVSLPKLTCRTSRPGSPDPSACALRTGRRRAADRR